MRPRRPVFVVGACRHVHVRRGRCSTPSHQKQLGVHHPISGFRGYTVAPHRRCAPLRRLRNPAAARVLTGRTSIDAGCGE